MRLPTPLPTIFFNEGEEGTGPTVGLTLFVTNGKVLNSPMIFLYQWKRCNKEGEECVNIEGATDHFYTITESDVGHKLRAAVTVRNLAGEAVGTSEATGVVRL